MKKVVHIIPALGFGGAERLVVDLINNLDGAQWRSEIIIFFDILDLAGELKNSTPVHLVPKRGRVSWHLVADLENKLKEIKPDLVHTHLFAGDLWGRLAARRLRLPVVTTEHGLDFSKGSFKEKIMGWLGDYSDHYVAVSEPVREYLLSTHHIAKPITVVPNGIDLGRFNILPPPEFNQPLKFLLIGRLTKIKDHRTALRALAALPDKNSWRLTIVGDGEEEKNIKADVRELGIGASVEFRPATTDVGAVYGEHDIVLMPSLWEGQGIVAMEALASGRLLIVSDCPTLRVFGESGVALMASKGDSLAWAEKIAWCGDDLAEIKKISARGRDYALKNFDIKNTARRYREIYDLVASNIKSKISI